MLIGRLGLLLSAFLVLSHLSSAAENRIVAENKSLKACADLVLKGFRKIADTRDVRFQGKVAEATAICRGGQQALLLRNTPWVDWSQYFGTGDITSAPHGLITKNGPAFRGVSGALLDLEYQRIELLRFNLFDNNGTYKDYVSGRDGVGGMALKRWDELRLPKTDPNYAAVGGDGVQTCSGELIRARTLTGICNDVVNPAMGSVGQLFARNVEFSTTFPDQGENQLTRNRHGDRLALLKPDPQVISRRLFTRQQSHPEVCNDGYGLPNDSPAANCDYQKAPFFNVLAAYWIQFMTHDWFSHLEEGHNQPTYMKVGCNGLSEEEVKKLGCRPEDRIDRAYVAQDSAPHTFTEHEVSYLDRAPKTFANTSTAWWDTSQIYGYDATSVKRVQRDPKDPAKLLLLPGPKGELFLPVLAPDAPMNPQWKGQEAAAFADNWTVGLSVLHNLFVREHNAFVDEFHRVAALMPNADSGLRNPDDPKHVITYLQVTPDELYNAARLVINAEIAKIHTTEWTPQLLYDDVGYKALNANWNGLFGNNNPQATKALNDIIVYNFGKSKDVEKASQWYSVFASGPGIFGLGSRTKHYDITNPEHLNAGVNHFGSPFNFPEEFITVYRLHSLVPDLLEFREADKDPNKIVKKIAVVNTFEAKATDAMHSAGMADWGVTLGRQRLGLLQLGNTPMFLQNLHMGRLDSKTQQIDVAALDLIRDREHGVPRFNEFRRQYGLRQLTSFDDFVDHTLPADDPGRQQQEQMIKSMREIYGTHVCNASKVITDAQLNADKSPINDCLGHANGSVVDNIEDVDTVVGWQAEYNRPHGYAISETQFVVFILNASRRLFSDRFFTSGFRPEFYTKLGIDWVNNNGPGKPMIEKVAENGHPPQPVLPMKRVLMRNIPELRDELDPVINAFDPWARDHGEYYSLAWRPRKGAESDDGFK
jgi:hypothetical protein